MNAGIAQPTPLPFLLTIIPWIFITVDNWKNNFWYHLGKFLKLDPNYCTNQNK